MTPITPVIGVDFNQATECVQIRFGNKTWCLGLEHAEAVLAGLPEAIEDMKDYLAMKPAAKPDPG